MPVGWNESEQLLEPDRALDVAERVAAECDEYGYFFQATKTKDFDPVLSVMQPDGSRKKIDVRIGRTPSEPQSVRADASATAGGLGLTLGELTPPARERFGVPPDIEGALVLGVDPASGAAEKGLQPGDVIVSVGQKPVASPADAKREIERLKAESRGSVLLRVVRGADASFVAVPFA